MCLREKLAQGLNVRLFAAERCVATVAVCVCVWRETHCMTAVGHRQSARRLAFIYETPARVFIPHAQVLYFTYLLSLPRPF